MVERATKPSFALYEAPVLKPYTLDYALLTDAQRRGTEPFDANGGPAEARQPPRRRPLGGLTFAPDGQWLAATRATDGPSPALEVHFWHLTRPERSGSARLTGCPARARLRFHCAAGQLWLVRPRGGSVSIALGPPPGGRPNRSEMVAWAQHADADAFFCRQARQRYCAYMTRSFADGDSDEEDGGEAARWRRLLGEDAGEPAWTLFGAFARQEECLFVLPPHDHAAAGLRVALWDDLLLVQAAAHQALDVGHYLSLREDWTQEDRPSPWQHGWFCGRDLLLLRRDDGPEFGQQCVGSKVLRLESAQLASGGEAQQQVVASAPFLFSAPQQSASGRYLAARICADPPAVAALRAPGTAPVVGRPFVLDCLHGREFRPLDLGQEDDTGARAPACRLHFCPSERYLLAQISGQQDDRLLLFDLDDLLWPARWLIGTDLTQIPVPKGAEVSLHTRAGRTQIAVASPLLGEAALYVYGHGEMER